MPTIKQKRAFKKIVENHGSVSGVMLEVGYDPTTAKNPKNLTDSKGWHELLEEYIPDELLTKKHLQLLNDDSYKAVSIGVDMGYKLKGRYAPTKNVNFNVVEDKPNPVLDEIAEKLNAILKGTD